MGQLVTESEKMRLKKLEELSKNIDALHWEIFNSIFFFCGIMLCFMLFQDCLRHRYASDSECENYLKFALLLWYTLILLHISLVWCNYGLINVIDLFWFLNSQAKF